VEVMTEAEYIQKVTEAKQLFRQDAHSPEPLRLVSEALVKYPNSAKLHCLLGDLIQLSDAFPEYELSDALKAYEKATVLDPTCPEAFEEIGYYYDAIDEDLEKSEAAFRRAVELGGGEQSYAGLGRVLVERGHPPSEVVIFLKQSPCADMPKVREMCSEIEAGKWSPSK